jgi:hypothetical protein
MAVILFLRTTPMLKLNQTARTTPTFVTIVKVAQRAFLTQAVDAKTIVP